MTTPDVCISQISINFYHETFTELVHLLAHGFSAIGRTCVARRLSVLEPREILRPGMLNVLVGDLVYAAPMLLDADGRAPFVVWQLEGLSEQAGLAPRYPAYVELLRRAHRVWDYNRGNLRWLAAWDIRRAQLLPLGYMPVLETVPQDRDQDIDVAFFGHLTPRRQAIRDALAAAGLAVEFRQKCYGEERNALIARARICLNLHAANGLAVLEEARIGFLLANHCFVVSEVADHDPYRGGVVFAPYDHIVETCRLWLQQPAASRRAVALRGHEALRQLPFLAGLRHLWRDAVAP